ncbi:MAG: glycoside hydrolase family 5 protein [archaeon]|nr:glycoside hydrolase family 5 protein [archaeon]
MISQLNIKGRHFVDEKGRIVILRGVNLAGISIPFKPNGATHIKENWPPIDLKNVTWEGRPFPLEESDIHFLRLKSWGFNCIRMLTSWEAIEHAGPYRYDESYLDYLTKLIIKAGNYGFYVFINFHQDVWSRVSGGDGAPLWLFDKIGLDYTKFDGADAAVNSQYLWDSDPEKDLYSQTSWGENSKLFPSQTMWTLFWAGNDFAPNLKIEDESTGKLINIENYLQGHFISAIEKIAEKIKDLPNVIGFNPINEPSMGYINRSVGKRILSLEKNEQGEAEGGDLGVAWSPLDTMAAAAGYSREIEELGFSITKGMKIIGKKLVNKGKICLWKEGTEDFWKSHGVWNDENGTPYTPNDNYFKVVDERNVDFTADYLVPFHNRVADIVRKYNKNWLLFIENDPELHGSVRYHHWPDKMPTKTVDAFHWYDLTQLGLKRFLWPLNIDLVRMKPVWGINGIQKMYISQMEGHIKLAEKVNNGNCPLLLGEFGISMDMSNRKAFKNWKKKGYKVFKKHDKILDLMYNALDKLLLSSTHWNYASFNTNKHGDMWCLEDLSIYSKDQEIKSFQENIFTGARGIGGFCRPFAQKIAGSSMSMIFNRKKREFKLNYEPIHNTNGTSDETIIYIPKYQYPKGYLIECKGAKVKINENGDDQIIFIKNTTKSNVSIIIKKKRSKK